MQLLQLDKANYALIYYHIH